jgi:hypothetical protein
LVVIVLQKITKDNREGDEGRVALLRKLGQGLINYFFNFRFAASDSKKSLYIYIYAGSLPDSTGSPGSRAGPGLITMPQRPHISRQVVQPRRTGEKRSKIKEEGHACNVNNF